MAEQKSRFHGGAEEKKPRFMRFTSEQVNAALGAVDPIYLTEAYLYRDLDHAAAAYAMRKSFQSLFWKCKSI